MSSDTVTTTGIQDGRADFDFLFGEWTARQRKLRDTTDRDCTEWIVFDTVSRFEPILGGLGNCDRLWVGEDAPGGPWEGFTMRVFDPEQRTWRLWWISSRFPGAPIDPPVIGRFVDGVGVFRCDDTVGGHPVQVEYEWIREDDDHARWTQRFSYDDGQTWQPNWIADFTRRR